MTLRHQLLHLPKATVVCSSQSGHAASNNINWMTDRKQITNVQRRNIECGIPASDAFTPKFYSRRKLLSKFQAEEHQPCSGHAILLNKQTKNTKSVNLMEKKDCIPGIYGTKLPLNTFSPQASHPSALESDCSVKKTFHSSEDKITSGGIFANTFYKPLFDQVTETSLDSAVQEEEQRFPDHYKAAMEQLADISLSNNKRTPELSSDSKQESNYSWRYPKHQDHISVSRNFKKPSAELASSSRDVPTHIDTNPPVHSFMKRYHLVSYPGATKTMTENYRRNGGGDFSKKDSEACTSDSYPATDSSSDDMASVLKCNLKTGSGNAGDKFSTEEKGVYESDKKRQSLMNYLKNVNINLKPEPIEHKEETSFSVDSNTFSYPDFLPPPYNTLDLPRISKLDDWRTSLNTPVDKSLDPLISRLVEMERLQHSTILKERTKETVPPSLAVNNRASSSKDVHQLKQLKPCDLSCPQATFDRDVRSFSSCAHEPNISKCTCQQCHSKWNSGASPPMRSSTKHSRAIHSTKCPKASVMLNSSNVVTRRSLSCSGSSSKIQPDIKTTCPKSSSPTTVVAGSLQDSESMKSKQVRTRRQSCRKNRVLMSKPIQSQAQKSLSLTSKLNCSKADHQ